MLIRARYLLKIDGREITEKFTFRVGWNSRDSLQVGRVNIDTKYINIQDIEIKEGGKLEIIIWNNQNSKVRIFEGEMVGVFHTLEEVMIEIQNSFVGEEEYYENFRDVDEKYCLSKVVDNVDYEGRLRRGFWDCRGKKRKIIDRILKGKYYYFGLDRKLIVRDKQTEGSEYEISDMITNITFNNVEIMPLPELELSDVVKFGGKGYLVYGIIYDYEEEPSMVLTLRRKVESNGIADVTNMEQTLVASKPVTPLFSPSKTQASRGETAESLLKQLDTQVKTHLEALAEQVRDEMKDNFESIVITSAYCSPEHQRDEIFLKKIKLSGNSSMYGYYRLKAPASAPYLKIIQYLYDGVYDHKIGSPTREQYLADLNAIEDIKKRNIFQGIIEEKYNDTEYVVDSYKKGDSEDDYNIKRLLTKSYVDFINRENPLFNPSFHVIGTESKKRSQAIDLSKSKESVSLKEKHNNKREDILVESEGKVDMGKAYDGSANGEPHIHATYKLSYQVIKKEDFHR